MIGKGVSESQRGGRGKIVLFLIVMSAFLSMVAARGGHGGRGGSRGARSGGGSGSGSVCDPGKKKKGFQLESFK